MSIEKIVVKIGDCEIEMTMDEARALWSDLDELFSAPKSDFEDFKKKLDKPEPSGNPLPGPAIPMPGPTQPYGPPYPPHNPYTIPIGPTLPNPLITWC